MSSTHSPIQSIEDPLFQEMELIVHIKRDDLLHPFIMGNKWRKLKYNLRHVLQEGFRGVVTLGGAFSNHIAATAAACNENHVASIGIIRGEELNEQSNATLRFAKSEGMALQFADRKTYRSLRDNPDLLTKKYPDFFVLPEGGTNHLAIIGCQELIQELPEAYDYVIVTLGTGGTMAGLLKGMNGNGNLIGISSLKGNFVKQEFKKFLLEHQIPFENYQIISRFHFGGYGKVTEELVAFINQTKQKTGLLFDPIYTGKMYFGVRELVKESFFDRKSKLLLIHTGGLQGIVGYNEFHEKKILI